MIHQSQLVVGKGSSRVIDRNRAARYTTVRVALVHRDAAELVFENLHGVEHRGGPIADTVVQASARGDQQRKAGAGLFAADADLTIFVERRAVSPCPVESCTSLRLTSRMLNKPTSHNLWKLFGEESLPLFCIRSAKNHGIPNQR